MFPLSTRVKLLVGSVALLAAVSVPSTAMSVELTAPTYTMVLDSYSGRYYELVDEYVTFSEAKQIAESHVYKGVQGRLIVINNESEHAFAAFGSHRSSASWAGVWIGLTDDPQYGGSEGSWVWTGPDGATPLSNTGYESWTPGEPNNAGSGENFAAIKDNASIQWNDIPDTFGNYALIEFGQEQEVAKGFYHRKVSGPLNDVTNTSDALRVINGFTPTSGEATAQTALYDFADVGNDNDCGDFIATNAFPGDNLYGSEDDFVMKSYATLNITEAGTYTIGGRHDDLIALSIDRGEQEAVNLVMPTEGNDPWGYGTATVNFDAPGTYNLYSLYGENWGGSGVELAMVKGDYDVSGYDMNTEAGRAAYSNTYNEFLANAALIGDTLNGGIATDNLRQIHTQAGFTVNGTTTDTVNFTGNSMNDGGSFGDDTAMTGGTATTVTSQLVVPENSGGWWTLGVSQSHEGTLSIMKDGEAVAFSQVNGGTNGAAVAGNGAMSWNAPTVGISDRALGAIYLEPGTYDLAVDYNPNSQTTTPQLTVSDFTVLNATPADGELDTYAETTKLMVDAYYNGASGALVGDLVTATYSTINFEENAGGAGHFGNTEYFPLFPEGQGDDPDYGTMVLADITVSAENAGYWSFCVNSDDGFGMQIYDESGNAISFSEFAGTTPTDEDNVFYYDGGRGAADSLATIELSEGTYSMALVHWDGAYGAALEISYASGEHLEFDGDLFNLFGADADEFFELFAAAGVHSEFDLSFDLLGDAINFEDQSEFIGEDEPEEKIAGDANNDGKVDGSDVTILAGNWQAGVGIDDPGTVTWEMGDFNGDGKVDGSDVTILAGNWQYGVSTMAASVPEPGILILLLGGIAMLFVVRRRK